MDIKASEGRNPSLKPARKHVVTIHDVAQHAGVSPMTVSRVITGKSYVSEALRDKVNASIKALNYSPNLTARSFSSAIRVGALYASPNSSNLGAFMLGGYKEAGTSGCQLSIESGLSEEEAVRHLQQMIEAGVGSVILPPPLCDSEVLLKLLLEADVLPIAFASAASTDEVSAIIVDDYKGACDLTRHLIGLGHQRIAFIQGDPKHSPSHRREQGYRAAMSAASVKIDERWVVPGLFTYKSGLDAAESLLALEPRPTAIFASNDAMAAAAIAYAAKVGLKVPHDLSVAGFDDAPIASTIWPELTTIRQPIADMAADAVALANKQLRLSREGRAREVVHKRVALKLVERASTGPVPQISN